MARLDDGAAALERGAVWSRAKANNFQTHAEPAPCCHAAAKVGVVQSPGDRPTLGYISRPPGHRDIAPAASRACCKSLAWPVWASSELASRFTLRRCQRRARCCRSEYCVTQVVMRPACFHGRRPNHFSTSAIHGRFHRVGSGRQALGQGLGFATQQVMNGQPSPLGDFRISAKRGCLSQRNRLCTPPGL